MPTNYVILVKESDGSITYVPETIAGSQQYDGVPTDVMPTGATPARLARRVGKAYAPETAKRTLNLGQFGSSPANFVFKLSSDFRPAELSHAQMRSRGQNMFSKWTSDQADGSNQWADVPDSERLDYETESSLNSGIEGHYYYALSLAQVEAIYNATIPVYGAGAHWTANIETSNYWVPDAYRGGGYAGWGSHWGAWDDAKGQTVVLESSAARSVFGNSCTIEALFANNDAHQAEQAVRRANRVSIMLLRAKSGGAYACYGSSMYQGEPKTDALADPRSRFRDEADADVSNIGGSGGTIVLNGRTYNGVSGSFYKHESCHLDYHYYFTYDFTGSNYDSITDYPTLWPYIHNRHPIAREVGHWLANQKRMKDVHGGATIPTIRMTELFFEDNFSRSPAAMGLSNGDGGSAKTWIPPYLMEIMYLTYHLLEGERPGSGFHIFHSAGAPNQGIEYDLATKPRYNHHLHTVSALFAARKDMADLLSGMSGTTLTTDIDIKIGGTGNFETVNGVTAYALGPDGGQGTLKPCFFTRHKTTAEGLYVIVAGGMDQGWNTTRTDIIRIPGVGNGNTISITYQGPSLQIFELLFPTGVTNTEFTARSIVPAWQKAGYGGRITNS